LNLGDQRSAPITELILEYALVVKDLVALYDEHQTSLDEILASVEKSKKQQESIQASLATELKAAREKSDHDTQKLAEDRRSMEQEFTNKEAQLSQTHREKCASVETRRSELESEYQLKKEGLDAEYREKESAITERSKELTDRIKQSDSELQSKKTALQTEYETKRQDLEASAAESKAKLEEAERLLKAREVSFEAKVAVEDEVQKKVCTGPRCKSDLITDKLLAHGTDEQSGAAHH
jgi:DNA repair exonuclease SbcCD ATPase subunit